MNRKQNIFRKKLFKFIGGSYRFWAEKWFLLREFEQYVTIKIQERTNNGCFLGPTLHRNKNYWKSNKLKMMFEIQGTGNIKKFENETHCWKFFYNPHILPTSLVARPQELLHSLFYYAQTIVRTLEYSVFNTLRKQKIYNLRITIYFLNWYIYLAYALIRGVDHTPLINELLTWFNLLLRQLPFACVFQKVNFKTSPSPRFYAPAIYNLKSRFQLRTRMT